MRAGTSRLRLPNKFGGASPPQNGKTDPFGDPGAPLLIYASLYALVLTIVILSEAKDLLFHADSYF
jgi:hypothetical protein